MNTNRKLKMVRPFLLAMLGITLYSNRLAAYADELTAEPSADHSSADEHSAVMANNQGVGSAVEQSAGSNAPESSDVVTATESAADSLSAVSESQSPVSGTIEQAEAVESNSSEQLQEVSSLELAEQSQTESAQIIATRQASQSASTSVSPKSKSKSEAAAVQPPAAPKKSSSLKNLSTDKASYRLGDSVNVNLTFTNTTAQAQNITASTEVYSLENKVGNIYSYSKYLTPGESYSTKLGDITIPGDIFENNHGYLLTVKVSDTKNNLLGSSNRAIAVENDWTVFPRYGAIGGSQKDNNSVLTDNLPLYYRELEQMKNMNINSYFFYDVYKSATNPFPNILTFDQSWNWWSHSKVETPAVKALVKRVHQGGAVAMLYNMILAQNTNEASVLPDTEYIYNYENGGYGAGGDIMTYFIDGKPLQRYYNPLSKSWQNYIANAMGEALKNGGFDGWQGDTIGDNRVVAYSDKDNRDFNNSFMLSDVYAEFLNKTKENLPNYYLTLNDVNGENIRKLGKSSQDVIYNELWPFGTSALGNRPQNSYGDLKARIDQVREMTGKSLIVGAYMEEPKFDDNHNPLNGAALDVLASATYQTDAVLLTTAAIAAAGGYHMSLAALANPNDGDGVGVLETAYYPTQSLKVSEELNRKNYNYQQFITAYENLLRDQVNNDSVQPETFSQSGQQLSHDALGTEGNQVWTYSKKGKNFRTIQLLNLMGITSDWKNEDGYANNKTPDEQTNLLVTYPLTGLSIDEARRIANQVYVTSPDDWLQSGMVKLEVQVKQDTNGDPVLYIQVPRLTLWDMVYITEEVKPIVPTSPSEPVKEPTVPVTPEKPIKEPTVPVTPETPIKEPTAPMTPAKPAEQQKEDKAPTEVLKESAAPSSQKAPEAQLKAQANSAKPTETAVSSSSQEDLPETGERKVSKIAAIVGAGILAAGAIGLLALKRRKN